MRRLFRSLLWRAFQPVYYAYAGGIGSWACMDGDVRVRFDGGRWRKLARGVEIAVPRGTDKIEWQAAPRTEGGR